MQSIKFAGPRSVVNEINEWIAQILSLSDSLSLPHWYFSQMNTYLHKANIYLDAFNDLI